MTIDPATTEDPRLGFTSASNAEADLLCPGRHLAQRGLAGYKTRESNAGTLVHAAFAGTLDPASLNPMQYRTVMRGKEIEAHVAIQWFRNRWQPDITKHDVEKRAHRELRLWAYRNGQRFHSGGVDALWLASDMKYALIEDLKSLFGDITEASRNEQLRDYAALVALNYGCSEVSVFINQPNVRWQFGDQEICTYKFDELEQSIGEMSDRVLASNDLQSPRYPGKKQCNFCLASGTSRCPESLKEIETFSKGYQESWPFWSPERRGDFVRLSMLTGALSKQVLEVAKAEILKDPKWAEGWKVTAESQVRSFEDVTGVFNVFQDLFSDHPDKLAEITEKMRQACGINFSDVQAIHRQYTEAETEAERDAEFKVLFGHLITTSTRAGSLKEVK
jgi:hypothetical protein